MSQSDKVQNNNQVFARRQILGYPVDLINLEQAIEYIEGCIKQRKFLHVVTINAEMIMQAMKNQDLDRIIRRAQLIIPDGSSVVLSFRLYGFKVSRLPGIELAYEVLKKCVSQGYEVALIGGSKEVLTKVVKLLPEKKLPGLSIVYSHHGYFTNLTEEEEVSKNITRANPKVVLIALGVPKQELFIERWQQYFPHSVIIGVGGSFDVWAGYVKRAPKFFCQLHLEWFYRLLKEPWRFQRIASSLPVFVYLVMSEYFKFGLNKIKKKNLKVQSTNDDSIEQHD